MIKHPFFNTTKLNLTNFFTTDQFPQSREKKFLQNLYLLILNNKKNEHHLLEVCIQK